MDSLYGYYSRNFKIKKDLILRWENIKKRCNNYRIKQKVL